MHHLFLGMRPWRKGRRKYTRPPGFEAEVYVLEPDFDDAGADILFCAQAIDAAGAISMHPDGDRRSTILDPVPLCSHVPDGGSRSEFPSPVRIRRELEQHHRWRKEAEERLEAEWEARCKAEWEERCRVSGLPDVPPRPKRPGVAMVREHAVRNWNRFTPSVEMLGEMQLHIPIARGAGRIWRNMVMMNEADESSRSSHWVEVWRGAGYILFNAEGSI